MKKIAVITMARNDAFFLKKWIAYYGAQFGEENLYIFLDGLDQSLPYDTGKVNVKNVAKDPMHVVKAEKARLAYLSQVAGELLQSYDLVIGCDADEYLVIDPAMGISLAAYLSNKKIKNSLSALGLDMGQNLNEEGPISTDRPFLQQRSYAVASPRYTKPVMMARPLRWGAGFHRIKGHQFTIDPHLYLVHLGYFDDEMIQARFSDKDRMQAGWGKHLAKRRRTITYVTERPAKDGDKWLPIARKFQQYFHQPYAWNKPSMGFWTLVVKLPERFKNIL